MILSNDSIAKQIGTVQPFNGDSADLGICPGANIWAFIKGEKFLLKKANYVEAKAHMDKKTGRRVLTPTAEQLLECREVTFKFIKLDDGRLLSLATLLRKNEAKFHADSKNLPESISISEVLGKIDGRTLEVVDVDKFSVIARNADGSEKKDAEGKVTKRDQKWYAFKLIEPAVTPAPAE